MDLRIKEAVVFIDENLEEKLSLERVSQMVNLSKRLIETRLDYFSSDRWGDPGLQIAVSDSYKMGFYVSNKIIYLS